MSLRSVGRPKFRRRLEAFRDVDVADTVLVTWSRHVDFFPPEFVFLSLVSKKVTVSDKSKIAEAILQQSDSQILRPANFKPIPEITPETKLPNLAQGPRVNLPFQLLKVGEAFLAKSPTEWPVCSQP